MGHDHAHHVGDYNRAFALGVTLNLGFVVVEFFSGYSQIRSLYWQMLVIT